MRTVIARIFDYSRLFGEITEPPRLELVSAIPFKNGILEVTYRRAR